jgi:hypothetical protein
MICPLFIVLTKFKYILLKEYYDGIPSLKLKAFLSKVYHLKSFVFSVLKLLHCIITPALIFLYWTVDVRNKILYKSIFVLNKKRIQNNLIVYLIFNFILNLLKL